MIYDFYESHSDRWGDISLWFWFAFLWWLISNAEHLFMHPLAICTLSLENVYSDLLSIFKSGVFFDIELYDLNFHFDFWWGRGVSSNLLSLFVTWHKNQFLYMLYTIWIWREFFLGGRAKFCIQYMYLVKLLKIILFQHLIVLIVLVLTCEPEMCIKLHFSL